MAYKRKPKKSSAIDRFLERHKDTCSYWIFSGNRHCSCGKSEAEEEVEYLRNRLALLETMVGGV